MLTSSLRRRLLPSITNLLHLLPTTTTTTSVSPSPFLQTQTPSVSRGILGVHSFGFSARSYDNDNDKFDDEKIGPDTILFEGCDYNHWLITMDFRNRDPKPTPEEMVETYVQTLAKVVGSVEEAKQRMYACSTTTYQGFQAVMSEEDSEKFKGLPDVVFILPDSYIDPVNKEYGGDKYINGTIIPRPPPVQHGRTGGRYGDRNRNYNQGPRQPMQQANQRFDRCDSVQGGGRLGSQQNYPSQQIQAPPQNYPQQQYRAPPQNYPQQQNYPSQQYDAPPQNYYPQPNQAPPSNYHTQQTYAPPQSYSSFGQGERRDSMPVGSRGMAPPGSGTFPSQPRDQIPLYQNQRYGGNISSPGVRGDNMSYTPSTSRTSNLPSGREYGQGPSFGQGDAGYGQIYPSQSQSPGVPPVDQNNATQGDQIRNPMPPISYNQGIF